MRLLRGSHNGKPPLILRISYMLAGYSHILLTSSIWCMIPWTHARGFHASSHARLLDRIAHGIATESHRSAPTDGCLGAQSEYLDNIFLRNQLSTLAYMTIENRGDTIKIGGV